MGMIEKPLAVRLTKKFAQVDGLIWREFQSGAVIRDHEIIEYLKRVGAPIESIADNNSDRS
jgi:hypothetical protein